jgi:hypothetical protein
VQIPSYDLGGEPKGMKRTTRWMRRIRGWKNDPMVRVRLFTAVRGAIAVWIPTLLVYNQGAFTGKIIITFYILYYIILYIILIFFIFYTFFSSISPFSLYLKTAKDVSVKE